MRIMHRFKDIVQKGIFPILQWTLRWILTCIGNGGFTESGIEEQGFVETDAELAVSLLREDIPQQGKEIGGQMWVLSEIPQILPLTAQQGWTHPKKLQALGNTTKSVLYLGINLRKVTLCLFRWSKFQIHGHLLLLHVRLLGQNGLKASCGHPYFHHTDRSVFSQRATDLQRSLKHRSTPIP